MSESRYKKFIEQGKEMHLVPFIEIPKKATDYYVYYIAGRTRFDILSYEYYKDSNYGWLILQANPNIGSLEFKIPDKTMIRIPYPLDTTLQQYNAAIETYKKYYGLN